MSEQKQVLVEVTLAKPHTHAEEKLPAGSKIQVSEPDRAWLIEHGIVEAPKGAKEGGK